jgi:predicted component of type VI protein secretion system
VCSNLDALLTGDRPELADLALRAAASLVILTHEGTHFTSVGSNEAVAECRAMQNAHKVAAAMGIDEDYARQLARLYWEELYAPGDPLYGSPECRDGGTLDVNPDDPAWP